MFWELFDVYWFCTHAQTIGAIKDYARQTRQCGGAQRQAEEEKAEEGARGCSVSTPRHATPLQLRTGTSIFAGDGCSLAPVRC
eukprot:COSAG05_NODE_19738_length_288_cov_0.947090_1_plen_82_part_10